jgi:hypothetical protein
MAVCLPPGLKIQCCGFDLGDIAVLCPRLRSLIIQKEAPNSGDPPLPPSSTSSREKNKIDTEKRRGKNRMLGVLEKMGPEMSR